MGDIMPLNMYDTQIEIDEQIKRSNNERSETNRFTLCTVAAAAAAAAIIFHLDFSLIPIFNY